MELVFDWGVSAFFGWGVFGINLALELTRYPAIRSRASEAIDVRSIGVDALRLRALSPFLARSSQGPPARDATWLHALGNDVLPERRPNVRIGMIFFEAPLSAAAVARAREYDIIAAGSTWNSEVLQAAGIARTKVVLQGVDRSLFFPAPKRNLFPGRFLIFSGGKAEPRKGQDIVVAAFKVFAAKHPEAMLVTAWHSPWPELARGMNLDLAPFAQRVIDVGPLPNGVMAPIYRECDVALFTNRAEGGTNLVAMECLACGIPTLLSDNTGHRDLLRMGHGVALSQRPGTIWAEWGETDVDEVVAALERIFQKGSAPVTAAQALPSWSESADMLVQMANSVHNRR